MDLSVFKKRTYTNGPTPIEHLRRFSDAVGGPSIFIKRDDMLGLTGGGNKTRKLEYLVADALDKGADTLITCGAVQSNHCRLTLAAAVREGLKCRLVLEERVPGSYDPKSSGNNFLFRLLGVEKIKVVQGGSDMDAAMQAVADELAQMGRKGYIIPGGGSNPIGAKGYVACAQEIDEQSSAQNIRIDRVVVPSGSSGTHAGLVTGFWGLGRRTPIIGINVSRDKQEQEALVYELVTKLSDHVGLEKTVPREKVICSGDYWRPMYSVLNPQTIEAIHLLAKTEGILIDPVYTGKAMAGLIDLSRKGYFSKDENVLFIHTGGSPALYAYTDKLIT